MCETLFQRFKTNVGELEALPELALKLRIAEQTVLKNLKGVGYFRK